MDVKYCVLPGNETVRLTSDGHIILIGETPRTIPERFVTQAKAAGCLTEAELNQLKAKLGVIPVAEKKEPIVAPKVQEVKSDDIDEDGWAPPPNGRLAKK